MTTLDPNTASALELHEKGYIPVPMIEGTKIPAVKGWNELQHESLAREDIVAKWAEARYGIAIVTRGLLVLDIDAEEKLEAVLDQCGLKDAPICSTPSGGYHVHARMRAGVERSRKIRLKGQPIDFLIGSSLSIVPPTSGYKWLTAGLPVISELPLARVAWTRERSRKRVRSALSGSGVLPAGKGSIRFPEAYCLRIESVQGANGSRALVRVVCVMRDAGRTRQETFDFIKTVWGPACCRPEWSDQEICHAIDRHYPQG